MGRLQDTEVAAWGQQPHHRHLLTAGLTLHSTLNTLTSAAEEGDLVGTTVTPCYRGGKRRAEPTRERPEARQSQLMRRPGLSL